MATDGSGNTVGVSVDGSGNRKPSFSIRIKKPVVPHSKPIPDEGVKQYIHEKQIDHLVFHLNSYDPGSVEQTKAAKALFKKLTPTEREILIHLVKGGPQAECNVFNAEARNTLMKMGLVTMVCNKGRKGYSAATHTGWAVYRAR